MPGWLRQSTAATVKVGPFHDDTDFKTLETALVIQKADVRLSKQGGTMAAASADQGASDAGAPHDALGVYTVSLNATDTNTLGRLRLDVKETGALSVWDEWQVVPAAVWDAYFASGLLAVNAAQLDTSALAAARLKSAALGMYLGSVTGATTATTLVDSGLTQSAADHWKGRVLIFLTGSLALQATRITAFTPGTDTLTFLSLTGAPIGGDTYIIV